MPHDPEMADELRALLGGLEGCDEKAMFGGKAFLINGNMCAGVHRSSYILRLGGEAAADEAFDAGFRPMDITGRPMKGWVMVDRGEAVAGDLASWVARAHGFASSLPPK